MVPPRVRSGDGRPRRRGPPVLLARRWRARSAPSAQISGPSRPAGCGVRFGQGAVRRNLVEFGILGSTNVVADGAEVPLGGPKRRAVLSSLLVDAGRPVPADRLIDALWPD